MMEVGEEKSSNYCPLDWMMYGRAQELTGQGWGAIQPRG